MAETLVVVSKVKKMVKEAGFRTGIDYVTALSALIEAKVKSSIEKVKGEANKKTLGAEDIQ